MLVLAIDTATPAVTAGAVELPPAGRPVELALRVTVDPRAHVELLAEHVAGALADAGATMAAVHAIVCGTGPGPFTGLRVGMVTAAALGDALELPVYGVCSLDAIALAAPSTGEPLLVVTDARRREVYWASYDADRARTEGPHVRRPAELAARVPELGVGHLAGAGAGQYADVFADAFAGGSGPAPIVAPEYPDVVGLVAAVASELRAGRRPDPFVPRYLRRPDAVEPARIKPVTASAR